MSEKDDFWNIERILPKTRKSNIENSVINTADVSNSSLKGVSDGINIKSLFDSINQKKSANSFEDAIIKERDYEYFKQSAVVNYAYSGIYNNSFTYPDSIRQDALHYFSKPHSSCEYVDYYSVRPSFSDLNSSQLDYYLYWRSEIYKGNYFHSSPSYALLFITEIINLPDKISASQGLELIINLWKYYFSEQEKYNRIILDVIFEYCIICNLPIPFEKLEKILMSFDKGTNHILYSLFVYDYLIVNNSAFSVTKLRFIFENVFGYTYKQSKYYLQDSAFKHTIDKSFYDILYKFFNQHLDVIKTVINRRRCSSVPIKVIRPAFVMFHMDTSIRRNIVYEYYSFDKNDSVFESLINIAKYLENKFRSFFGIRTRLYSEVLPVEIKSVIDNIFFTAYSKKTRTDVPLPSNQIHEKFEIDIKSAQTIEENSWQTTKMLTEGIEIFEDITENPVAEQTELSDEFNEIEKGVLHLLISSKKEQASDLCRNSGVFLDSVVAAINEKSLNLIGDILVNVSNHEVYEDYIEEIYNYLQ